MWNQFDSGAQTSDAGYMDESRMDTTIDDDKKGGKRADNLVPIMIGHLNSSGPELLLFGQQVRVVSILGIIRNIEQVTTKVTYTVEDETGTIKAIKWNAAEDESESKEPLLNVGSYAHVYGLPREQDGEKHVLVLRICPLKNLNDLTNHLAEVVYVAQAAASAQHPIKKPGAVADTTSAMQNLECTGMDKDQAFVFQIINSDTSENGIERDDIKAKVPPNVKSKVDDILEFLAGEGHIYTTRTDNHFKAT